MKKIVYTLAALLMAVLSSCSNTDYLNAIPAESKLLMGVDPARVSGAGSPMLLKTMLRVARLDNTGLDLSAMVYLFEDARGNIGVCAKVADADQLAETLGRAGGAVTERRGFHFTTLPSRWVAGWSDKAALVMGPVLPAAEAETVGLMARYLAAGEDGGVAATPLYAKLDSLDAPMALVCQAEALPEQLVAPFTLGAPKEASPADVMVAAEMQVEQGTLLMRGETFSFRPKLNAALHRAAQTYRPINGRYVAAMDRTDAVGLFLNVDGRQFIELMRSNRGLKTMLAGINAALDMDNIIKSVDGDMALVTPSMDKGHFQMMMAAKLRHADWLADVDYWKQSAPAGSIIGDWGRDCYYYRGDNTTYYFGVTPDWQYMSGGTPEAALRSVKAAPNPIDKGLQARVRGERLAMVVNLAALDGKAEAVTALLKPMFGDLRAIVYTLK